MESTEECNVSLLATLKVAIADIDVPMPAPDPVVAVIEIAPVDSPIVVIVVPDCQALVAVDEQTVAPLRTVQIITPFFGGATACLREVHEGYMLKLRMACWSW